MGGYGGGVIFITAQSFVFNGTISANGLAGATNQIAGAGGGSGGSIIVNTTTIALGSDCAITANGGDGGKATAGGGRGAGGRILIVAQQYQLDSNSIILATGGSTQCNNYLQNGTVLFQCNINLCWKYFKDICLIIFNVLHVLLENSQMVLCAIAAMQVCRIWNRVSV